jgi:hypothetical protein
VKFVVGKVALGQVFLRVLRFYPANIIPSRFSVLIYHLGDERGCSSVTQSYHIDMNSSNIISKPGAIILKYVTHINTYINNIHCIFRYTDRQIYGKPDGQIDATQDGSSSGLL